MLALAPEIVVNFAQDDVESEPVILQCLQAAAVDMRRRSRIRTSCSVI